MSKNLYIIATEPRTGKSAVALGLMQLVLRDYPKVAFFRPIITQSAQSKKDKDIDLILSHFYLPMRYEDCFVYTLRQAREMINKGQHDLMLETILGRYKELEKNFDFVLVEGTDYLGDDAAFEFDINAEIAANLSCPVLLVANGAHKSDEDVVGSTRRSIDAFVAKSLDTLGVIVNRAECKAPQDVISGIKEGRNAGLSTYIIPEEPSLGKPSMADVRTWLGAEILHGKEGIENRVEEYIVAAMQIGNFLNYLKKDSLVVTPGDRADIILATLASRSSAAYPDAAGILLTGGIEPPETVKRLIDGWTGVPVPVLTVKEHTFKVTQTLLELHGRIDSDDQKKIASALGVFDANVDADELRGKLVSACSTKITPKMFEYNLIMQARQDKQCIVLPEGNSERVLRAADIILRRDVADLAILGNVDEINKQASQLGLNLGNAQIIDPAKDARFEEYANTYYELRKQKGVTPELARDIMADPTYFGTMMVHKNHAQGMVSGSINTTQATIRPAFEFVKTKPGFTIVSSVFFMCLKDRVLVFGDCAVNPNPNASQLAEIAVASAHTAMAFGIHPKVAMLSYSSGASGKGEEVEKVREATRLAQEREPEIAIEGPLQYDAAIDPEVAHTKMPDSKVAGQATVFIFPDLNTGNNTYKAVQRAADALAVGPVLQGLNKPVNDLSRGCTIEDIVNTVAITAIQAQAAPRGRVC